MDDVTMKLVAIGIWVCIFFVVKVAQEARHGS